MPGPRPRASRARAPRTLNLRLDLAYDGEPFRGFARQTGQRTVQGDLEDALSRLWGNPVRSTGAGRTDAGVHALGQVVSTEDAPDDTDLDRLKGSLNGMCGPAMAVHGCRIMPADFNARFSARSRTYVYAILTGEPDPWLARTTLLHRAPLDAGSMSEAAGHLIGVHDFTSFGRIEPGASAERNLYELTVEADGRLVRVMARANGFIQQMVRSLVGTLIEVGEGKRSPSEIPRIIDARERSAAGAVAPPHGLCLVAVEYDAGWSGAGV